MAVEKIIFDLGRVLVKFNVRNLFRKIITTEEEIDYFLQNICTWGMAYSARFSSGYLASVRSPGSAIS